MKKLVFFFLLLGTVMGLRAQVVVSSGNGQEYATVRAKDVTDSTGSFFSVREVYMQKPSEIRPDKCLTTISIEMIEDSITHKQIPFYWIRIFDAASNTTYFGGISEGMNVVKKGDCITFYNVPVKEYQPEINWDDEKIYIQRNAGSYRYQMGGDRRAAPKKATPPQKTLKPLTVVQDSTKIIQDSESFWDFLPWN